MKIEAKRILYAFYFPLLFVIILWIVWIFEKSLRADWSQLGILPRSWDGLLGILTEPLIHGGIQHLFSNSIPLLILGWCLFYFYKDLGYAVFPCLWILSGTITWFIGRESWHIGASGLVYALSFFLFFSGIFRRYIPLLAISMLIAFLYGSTVWNMFPVSELVDASISWEGHLSGAISGLVCAGLFRNYGPKEPEVFQEDEEDEEENEENEKNEEDIQ